MFFLIKITKTTLAIYDNYVINVYYKFDIGSYTDDNLFHFDTFQLHLFYQNISINILKLQKKHIG